MSDELPGDLRLSISRQGACAVISVGGEIDVASAGELNQVAVTALAEIGPYIVLDLTDVTFMDSSGLKVLLAIHKRAHIGGGRMVLANAPRPVKRVVTITGLDQTFAVCDSVATAVATCVEHAPGSTA